jgi:hypothetical protein
MRTPGMVFTAGKKEVLLKRSRSFPETTATEAGTSSEGRL